MRFMVMVKATKESELGDEGAGRRILADPCQVEGGSDRVDQALPRSLRPGPGVGDRDPPDL
jgi:hypothetical protein